MTSTTLKEFRVAMCERGRYARWKKPVPRVLDARIKELRRRLEQERAVKAIARVERRQSPTKALARAARRWKTGVTPAATRANGNGSTTTFVVGTRTAEIVIKLADRTVPIATIKYGRDEETLTFTLKGLIMNALKEIAK